jgi:hypothetical protein
MTDELHCYHVDKRTRDRRAYISYETECSDEQNEESEVQWKLREAFRTLEKEEQREHNA